MRSLLRLWWHRIKALWKWLVASVLLPLPLDALHEWLRHWIAGQSGWFVPILRAIVNNSWFPWGLLPVGVLVLVVKAYADAKTLASVSPTTVEIRPTSVGVDETPLPLVVNEVSKYSQWAGAMRHASRDGQLVGVVADFGHAADRFDSKEKFLLPNILSEYLDVRAYRLPLVMQDYAEFEFFPTQDGRRIWLRAERSGVMAVEVWRSWPRIPWDWLLAEAYSSLLYLRDARIFDLFRPRDAVQVTLTLGNLLTLGGTKPDVNVTARGLRLSLVPGDEVRGDRPRFQSVQHGGEVATNTDPWVCAKAFVKRTLADTGVLLFEEHLERVDKNAFLGLYFHPPDAYRRPIAQEAAENQGSP